MTKHLLKMDDFSGEEIIEVLNLADQLKYEVKHNINNNLLKNKTLGMIFEKSSTRTRVSFETGMYQLGGHALFLSSRDLQIGRGEPINDTARVLSRYLDCIMIRTFEQEKVNELAKFSSIPIINGLTDDEHPCQILADLMTIREYKKILKGLKIAFIGDGNNMAQSFMIACPKLGIDFSLACPNGYTPKPEYIEYANKLADENNVTFSLVHSPAEAAKDADVLITDVWASMGQEDEAERRKIAFTGYQINTSLLEHAKPNAIVLHCLPAHREEEITAEVFEAHADEIFDEAENRLHVQKAVMVKLVKH
ncbi:ornithine carbamoyltransferase [Inconstantimicrobium mannanitabidum]|uniref:Ornithine carbamoyltransferase n=1 Tax=Inconstantimicrobium mannanitabidum TaxID=1604901 RepID=A0ACB5RDE6_9CLOT|nr:ornithine carbamoyltransferase [Clostridium sp. TW13]GKX67063.1 ornithine carbamoyltransferase [Clostridium sp. TW13]